MPSLFHMFSQKSVFARVAEVSQLNINLNGIPIGAAVSATMPAQRVYKVGFDTIDVWGDDPSFAGFEAFPVWTASLAVSFAVFWYAGHVDDQFELPSCCEAARNCWSHWAVGKRTLSAPVSRPIRLTLHCC